VIQRLASTTLWLLLFAAAGQAQPTSAQVALFDRRLDEAVSILERLLACDPHNTQARRDLAGTYVELKDYAKARANFQQVLAVAPDDDVTQFELGVSDERIAPEAQQCRHQLETVEQKMK
jgi:Flp pilus assembly protein TadD